MKDLLRKCGPKFACISNYLQIEMQPPYCGGLQPSVATEEPFGPKCDFAGRTDGRTTGLRELEIKFDIFIQHIKNFVEIFGICIH